MLVVSATASLRCVTWVHGNNVDITVVDGRFSRIQTPLFVFLRYWRCITVAEIEGSDVVLLIFDETAEVLHVATDDIGLSPS